MLEEEVRSCRLCCEGKIVWGLSVPIFPALQPPAPNITSSNISWSWTMVVSASSICGLLVFLIIIPFLQWNLYQWISSSSSHAPTRREDGDDTPSPLYVSGSREQELQINKLKRIAYANPEGSQPFIESWQQILDLDERNLEAHVVSTFYFLLCSYLLQILSWYNLHS